MIHEKKKVAKIVEELTMFFFTIGAEKMESGIELMENEVKITFAANYFPEFSHSIDHLEAALNEPKNEGMEDIYWELAGSGDPGESSQLLLVGMMVDRYEMKREEGYVEITLYKEMLL